MTEQFSYSKVATKNFFIDMLQTFRNLFGMELKGYEDLLDKGTAALLEKANLNFSKIEWFRFSINELTNGAIMITIYGEGNRR